eukprot:GHVP01024343.1.p1 GENE.GHVP01024343.1~~GHVP01024343.1.p1  ORF type:complete len:178 (-),score=28.65 GHVP01024343.1:91-624(-)
MGLWTMIKKERIEESRLRILILGLDNSGKSTVVKRLMNEDIEMVTPTFGFEIKTVLRDNRTLDIWDIGGQKSIRPYWQSCFDSTDAVIWVVDSTDLSRIDSSKDELLSLMSQNRLRFTPLLILANKQDIEGAASPSEIRSFMGVNSLEADKICVFGTSAHTGIGIMEGFDWLVASIK